MKPTMMGLFPWDTSVPLTHVRFFILLAKLGIVQLGPDDVDLVNFFGGML
jgi:hypothetical protein